MGACCCLFFFTYNLIRFVYNSMYKCPSASDFFEFNCYLHPKQHCISIWSLTFSVSKFCIAISALDIDHIDNSHNKFCLFLLQWKYVWMVGKWSKFKPKPFVAIWKWNYCKQTQTQTELLHKDPHLASTPQQMMILREMCVFPMWARTNSWISMHLWLAHRMQMQTNRM